MKKEITLLNIIPVIIQKKKIFYITGSLAIVLSAIVAFVAPVYYKSTCILYPYNPAAYDPRSISTAINPYGSSTDGNRIMAVAESRDIHNYIAHKYDLMNRYEIDTLDPLAKVKLLNEYSSNLIVKENNLSAIEITFYDKNPDTAAFIVNDIVFMINEINKRPLIEIGQKILESSENIMNDKYKGIDSIQKIISLLDFKNNFSRSEIISSEVLHSLIELNIARKNLDLIKQDFNTMNIIEKAEPSAKKAKPQRLFIILGTFLATMFITLIIVFIKDIVIPMNTQEEN